ncbi:MAG: carboxypeptidase-like regulatory domain-containing protein [Verrucomicrobia bacterium]|nr:carboxypeptidase-like regulatory domain-containing protein [Verrucomicrobiota bacterium]
MPGEYVIRVSSPLGSFPPATARLTIEEVPTDQFFYGQVVDNQGTTIPGAFVALLQPLGGYSEILFAARADETGNYRLYAPTPDEVDVVAVAPGFVGPFQMGNSQVISDGDELEYNITLTPGTVNLAGQTLRYGSNEPIAGLPVTFLTTDEQGNVDGRLMTHTWTDANGEFSVQVTPDRWIVVVKTYEASSRNLIAPGDEAQLRFDLRDSIDVTDAVVYLKPGISLIAGILTGDDGIPLNQVQVVAVNRDTLETTSGFTLPNGAFTLPATPGFWEVSPYSFDLEVAWYPGATTSFARITEPNQSLVLSKIAFEINAILDGTITYESNDPEKDGQPVGGLSLWAQNIVDGELVSVFQRTYNFNGYYNLYLSEGDWLVIPLRLKRRDGNCFSKTYRG